VCVRAFTLFVCAHLLVACCECTRTYLISADTSDQLLKRLPFI